MKLVYPNQFKGGLIDFFKEEVRKNDGLRVEKRNEDIDKKIKEVREQMAEKLASAGHDNVENVSSNHIS